MSIHVALNHKSIYRYDRQVSHTPHSIRLRPAPHCRTPVLSYSLAVSPEDRFLNWQQDPFGNYIARVVFPERTDVFSVEVDLVAEMAVINPFDFFVEESAEEFPFQYSNAARRELGPFLRRRRAGARLREFMAKIDLTPRRTIDFLVDLNALVSREISYLIRLEPGVQTPEVTLAKKSGSCRDSAWLLVNVLRRLGLASRFVSGYLIQLKPDVKSLDGPSGTEVDFTDLHAWTEVFLPGAGWVGLDPTSGLFAGEGHLPVACAPEPTSASPIVGATDPCEVDFKHEMSITRIFEAPRVTKPYTEEQWSRIEALGLRLDEELKKNDLRLTMGGEPTFISIDDIDGEEWNFTALSPEKRALSVDLIRRLKARFAPGGLFHYGQGKWYPGEQLPRWALSCYWRKDGQPIWRDDDLLVTDEADLGHDVAEAERFTHRLARVLGVGVDHIMPAYEDAWYYLWRERQLPSNVDPINSKLSDERERIRFARLFNRGLEKAAGYVMPLRRAPGADAWESGHWFLRREHLFLVPGDSPIGLRLPLDSLPWVHESDYPHIHHPDPFSRFPSLPVEEEFRRRAADGSRQSFIARSAPQPRSPQEVSGMSLGPEQPAEPDPSQEPPAPGESAAGIVRTAVCVEPRDGRLHIFMPPVESTESYLSLVAAIEETASDLKLPVVIEGETPPHDSRLNVLKVTPDPGVIEVNVPPCSDWDELTDMTTVLYDEARLSRLGTEKFMIDGRHVGTGGGNHIVIGGATPADSPFLRRPELLRSLIGYWQNHPSLSYLFSGQFIGPTSQHPRIDEARNDSLSEMEIAFNQLPVGATPPPWLADRLFRNLLTDLTGNTHRAEICIDKLFSPDSATGRLGLVELRAFEMPPHARMSLAQQLLIRGLIAGFWNEPYRRKLVHWQTSLHDRFLLPHFCEADFQDVIADLNDLGFPFEPGWFAPHLEFRFPEYGSVVHRGVELELRQALEPWNVLGEQAMTGGTARAVDSSLERLQVKVRGLTESRHIVCCNGRRLPLHPTGVEGEYVAGVRFRAWQPPDCLHPTIPVHAPLTFDLLDTWNSRSLGGCQYHVADPAGRAFEDLPVNAYSAESRRLSRFTRIGHSPDRMPIPPEERNPEFPLTLDLRA